MCIGGSDDAGCGCQSAVLMSRQSKDAPSPSDVGAEFYGTGTWPNRVFAVPPDLGGFPLEVWQAAVRAVSWEQAMVRFLLSAWKLRPARDIGRDYAEAGVPVSYSTINRLVNGERVALDTLFLLLAVEGATSPVDISYPEV